MIEFKLVNDEVAPLDEMNFLGLLCKVRGGQGERFGKGLTSHSDGVLGRAGDFSLRRRLPEAGEEDSRRDQQNKDRSSKVKLLSRAVTHINLVQTRCVLSGVQAGRE